MENLTGNMEDTPVLPVFILSRDIVYSERNDLTPFRLSKAIADCVTFNCIEGCQK